jgi:hypothetical protein
MATKWSVPAALVESNPVDVPGYVPQGSAPAIPSSLRPPNRLS